MVFDVVIAELAHLTKEAVSMLHSTWSFNSYDGLEIKGEEVFYHVLDSRTGKA